MPLRYNLPTLPHSDGPPRSEEARLMTAPASARVMLDDERVIGPISPLLFGGFAEHMGRCIYRGIYGPGSPLADERGFRRDVLEALGELPFRTIRYPGGTFLSGYRWRDGIGPAAARPRRRDLAWRSTRWCRRRRTRPPDSARCRGSTSPPATTRRAGAARSSWCTAAWTPRCRPSGAGAAPRRSAWFPSSRCPGATKRRPTPSPRRVPSRCAHWPRRRWPAGRAALDLPPLSFTVVRYE